MAGYRCRVQGTRPSVFRPSLPPNLRSIDGGEKEREKERGDFCARGLRRERGDPSRFGENWFEAVNDRGITVDGGGGKGRREREREREEGGTRSLIDVCRKSDRYFGTIRLFFLGQRRRLVQGHLVANHLESVVYALLLFFSFLPFLFLPPRFFSLLFRISLSLSLSFFPFFSAV